MAPFEREKPFGADRRWTGVVTGVGIIGQGLPTIAPERQALTGGLAGNGFQIDQFRHLSASEALEALFTPWTDISVSERRAFRDSARYLSLRGLALTAEATALVQTVLNNHVLPSASVGGKTIRPTSMVKLREGVTAIVSDLLIAASGGEWCSRSIRPESFTEEPIGRTAFESVKSSMETAGLLVFVKGFRKQREGFSPARDEPPCFRATPALVALASSHGISMVDVVGHFGWTRPFSANDGTSAEEQGIVIETRTSATKDKDGRRISPKPITLSDSRQAAILQDQMAKLNAYLLKGNRVAGFAFGGIRRVFSDADKTGFDWQWGGRFYSRKGWDAYERWSGGLATRKRRIRIDGQAVVEVDIAAAFLTIVYGLAGVAFDPSVDPCQIDGFDRERVKGWITSVFGQGTIAAGGRPCNRVRVATVLRHPVLANFNSKGIGWQQLQYYESEILIRALERLSDDHGIIALPMHDGLIVAERDAQRTKEAIEWAFSAYFRDDLKGGLMIIPRVVVK